MFRVFRDTRERAREHLIPRESFVIYMYGSIDDDWNDGRAMDPARGFFYLCQIIAIGSSGRKAGKHSRYLQIAMRHARASAFFALFRAWFRRDTPSPGNGPPLLSRFFYSLPRKLPYTRTEALQRFPIPVAKHAGRSIYFCFFSSSFLSFPLSILPLRVQIGAQVSI